MCVICTGIVILSVFSYKFLIGTRIMSSARARGLATQPPENTPEREDLLLVRAFALGQMKAHGVSPLRESDTAPPLAVSKDVAAETLSRSENTETDLSARVTIGDEVSPLTIDISIPVSTENSGSLHTPVSYTHLTLPTNREV